MQDGCAGSCKELGTNKMGAEKKECGGRYISKKEKKVGRRGKGSGRKECE
jgi:hypothetical protein